MSYESNSTYTTLSVFADENQVTIQPRDAANSTETDTLLVQLESGAVSVKKAPPKFGNHVDALALLGVCKLFKGSAVVVVTEARRAATLGGADIYEVTATQVITSRQANAAKENAGLLRLLRDGVDPRGSGRGLYFAYFYDLTLTAQRAAALSADSSAQQQPPASRADGRFFWNAALAKPVLEAGGGRFVLPFIMGFVEQLEGVVLQGASPTTRGEVAATLTLIARRSVHRAGTRHWRRGADQEGNVANFVESEQVVVAVTPSGPVTSSFVQVRGSIPLLWTELPNIKYKPTRLIAPPELQAPVFTRHMLSLIEQYKGVLAINLVNQHGGEGKLASAFGSEAERFSSGSSGLRYVAFDFHKECGAKRYHNIANLYTQIEGDLRSWSYFQSSGGGGVTRRQGGVVRTNCIDCLDRTNVLQGVLARKALEYTLVDLGLLVPTSSLPAAYPELEQRFKVLWANHGDAVSTQYAGTGAMKSGFTRTGKRTMGGLVDDGYKSVARYYLNNFQDGKKQDAVDLVTGAYAAAPGARPPFKRQSSPLVPLIIALVAIFIGARRLAELVSGAESTDAAADSSAAGRGRKLESESAPGTADSASAGGAGGVLRAVGSSVLPPLLLGLGLLLLVFKNGRHLVNKPQLCPQLAATVAKPARKR